MRNVLNTKRSSVVNPANLGGMTDDTRLSVLTFEAFCNNIRFPNCMAPLLRHRCYLLACQQAIHFRYQDYSATFLPDNIAKCMNENPISFPHEASLNNSIGTLILNMHPFEELKNFRKQCFASYANVQSDRLTMTDYLRLYVAAYQVPSLWKQLWTHINPLMSTQISKDVESFVRSTPFATDSFIKIMKTSSPFGSANNM
jgi:hypothetical protein